MDQTKKSRLGSIFGGLLRKKPTVVVSTIVPEPPKLDNVECSMISHIDELSKMTEVDEAFVDLGVTGKEDIVTDLEGKKDQEIIVETQNLLQNLIAEYPFEISKIPELPEIPKISKEVKLSMSTRGKTSILVSYNFYKCNMVMEYSNSQIYNFDNDLVINPGKYDVLTKFDGINVGIQLRMSEYSAGDTGKFYKTENLEATDNLITIEVPKKSKLSFFAFPKKIGNSYDIKIVDVFVNLLE